MALLRRSRRTRLGVAAVVAVAATAITTQAILASSGRYASEIRPASRLEFHPDMSSVWEGLPNVVMPQRPNVLLSTGERIEFTGAGGLTSLEAEVAGANLRSSGSAGETLSIDMPKVVGSGPMIVEVTQQFGSGERVHFPITAYAVSDDEELERAVVRASSAQATPVARLSWDEVTIIPGDEGDIIGPQAFVTSDNKVFFLDTAGARVLVLDARTGIRHGSIDLPSRTFSDIAISPDGSQIVAIDQVNALAFDVLREQTLSLPLVIKFIPLGVDWVLQEGSQLSLRSPADGAVYSFALLTDKGATMSELAADIDQARPFFDEDGLYIQTGLENAPVEVDLREFGIARSGLSFLQVEPQTEGLVALVAAGSGQSSLLVSGVGRVDLITLGDLQPVGAMNNPIAVSNGGSVFLATSDDAGIVIWEIDLPAA